MVSLIGFAGQATIAAINPTGNRSDIAQQQTIELTGTVVNSKGEAIVGCGVVIKNSTIGTVTDLDGHFILSVPVNSTIQFSCIGYESQEIKLTRTNNHQLKVVLHEDVKYLDEVVVIGYGQQKKSSIVSSINTIKADNIVVKSTNIANGIAGKLPGVIAVQRSGEPGNDGAAFFIRGTSSYSGGTNPLVIVDGIPRNMNDIDVDEIETFTVLKDAAATAVYGAEGANGVVLITSKRGQKDKLSITATAQVNVLQPTRIQEFMNSYDVLNMYNEAVWNDNGNPTRTNYVPTISQTTLEKYRDGTDLDLYPNAQWTDLLAKSTLSQRYTIGLRGGNDRVRYYASGSYYGEQGVFKSTPTENYNANIGFRRFNLRSNVDIDVTKSTLLSLDMSGQYVQKNNPGFSTDDIFNAIYRYPVHVIPARYSDGTFSDDKTQGWGLVDTPYNMLNNSGYSKHTGAFLQTKVSLIQKLDFITKGLSAKAIVSFDTDYSTTMRRFMTPETWFASGRNEDGNLIKTRVKSGTELGNPENAGTAGQKKIYIEASVNYSRIFANKHDVNVMALYMQKENQFFHYSGMKMLPYRKQSVVARASYAYDKRYILEANMGLTGSENFAAGHRWGIFPAVGAAWYISQEQFMKGLAPYLSNLRLRASYGLTGNDDIGHNDRFPYRGTLNTYAPGYDLGLSQGAGGSASNWVGGGIIEDNIAVPTLTWEKESKVNVGLDLGLFDGRISLGVDWFTNRRYDILLKRKTMSGVTGIPNAPFQNYGIVTNTGVDLNLELKHSFGDFDISALGNFTFAKNKIVEYDEIPPRNAYQKVTGYSLGKPLIFIADGLYKEEDFDIYYNSDGSKNYVLKEGLPNPNAIVRPGDLKYMDLNGDNKIDDYDKTREHGFYSSLPEIVYGFGLNAQWKGIFFGMFFQGTGHASQNLMANNTTMIPFRETKDSSSSRTFVSDHWSAENPDNCNVLYPRMHSAAFEYNFRPSTWWYRQSNFLRLKNIELGYEFPKALTSKAKINNLRIYFQGNNIAVIDHIKFWDPELDAGASGSKYPLNRTFTFGLDITF